MRWSPSDARVSARYRRRAAHCACYRAIRRFADATVGETSVYRIPATRTCRRGLRDNSLREEPYAEDLSDRVWDHVSHWRHRRLDRWSTTATKPTSATGRYDHDVCARAARPV